LLLQMVRLLLMLQSFVVLLAPCNI